MIMYFSASQVIFHLSITNLIKYYSCIILKHITKKTHICLLSNLQLLDARCCIMTTCQVIFYVRGQPGDNWDNSGGPGVTQLAPVVIEHCVPLSLRR